jgi:GDP-L-fucose synthase
VKDLAEACLFLMETFSEPGPINVGTGVDISIKDLALLVREVVGYEGRLAFDKTKPDGTPRKLLDVARINATGWHAKINLPDGVKSTFDWYVKGQEVRT